MRFFYESFIYLATQIIHDARLIIERERDFLDIDIRRGRVVLVSVLGDVLEPLDQGRLPGAIQAQQEQLSVLFLNCAHIFNFKYLNKLRSMRGFGVLGRSEERR